MSDQHTGRQQHQFLKVIDRDEAERRFHGVLDLSPLAAHAVALNLCHGRVLSEDIVAPIDVPGFDRSNVDGFAVRASDTYGASEEVPRELILNRDTLATAVSPTEPVRGGTATVIATGAVVPRGADAVVMVEHTSVRDDTLLVRRPAAPGNAIAFAGSDIGRGETVLRKGTLLGSRECGVVAALGFDEVPVYAQPSVAVISTGNEIVAPGQPLKLGHIYDSNATILCAAVSELGAVPAYLGIAGDDIEQLTNMFTRALSYDVVLLSGGTSKGAGDLSYEVVRQLSDPGIVAHGVALKPGKPICLAATRPDPSQRPKPVVILPGFPTSAIFTFHEFVAPVITALAGRRRTVRQLVAARMAFRVNSERGRTEYLLVGLVDGPKGLSAYPMGKGSGSVTTFSHADGFVVIDRNQEQLETDAVVSVQQLGTGSAAPDLVIIGSHCVGLDVVVSKLSEEGLQVKVMAVGSQAGLMAAERGECDLAGIHLLDQESGEYNRPFLVEGLGLERGYLRMQGLVFRRDDPRFSGTDWESILTNALAHPELRMVNRNRGSGTRILFDGLAPMQGRSELPDGYFVEVRSHNAVVAAVEQERADWGIAIESVCAATRLRFVPIREEHYDFVVPEARRERPAVRRFFDKLRDPEVVSVLRRRGFEIDSAGDRD